jgi:hypothetical protein
VEKSPVTESYRSLGGQGFSFALGEADSTPPPTCAKLAPIVQNLVGFEIVSAREVGARNPGCAGNSRLGRCFILGWNIERGRGDAEAEAWAGNMTRKRKTDAPPSCTQAPLSDRPSRRRRALFQRVCELDLESIVAKQKFGPYVAEREQSTWFKILNREYSQKDGREELFERDRHSEPDPGWRCPVLCSVLLDTRWSVRYFPVH